MASKVLPMIDSVDDLAKAAMSKKAEKVNKQNQKDLKKAQKLREIAAEESQIESHVRAHDMGTIVKDAFVSAVKRPLPNLDGLKSDLGSIDISHPSF